MTARKQNTLITLDCKVSPQENLYSVTGTFQCRLAVPFDSQELDQIEANIEHAGQEFKRQLTQQVLEAASRRTSQKNVEFDKTSYECS